MLLSNGAEFERVKKKLTEVERLGVSSSLKSSTITKKQKVLPAKPIENSFSIMERDMVDMQIMRGLCANGIPFNVLRNPHLCEMVKAINKAPKDYKPPSFEKAHTILPDECKRGVEKDLFPIRDTWHTQGVSIVSDGWSNVKHEPLINVIVENSRGAMFLYANDFAGVEKTGSIIAEFLLKAIEEVGPSNMIQVVTNNAKNCVAAGKEIEKVHRHIFWSPCVVHALNLVFKDFAEAFEWLRNTYRRGKNIIKFFLNHSHVLAMYRSQAKLNLLKIAKTRFGSHYIMLQRLLIGKEELAATVILDKWTEWLKRDDEKTKLMGGLVAETILDSESWDVVRNITKITEPLHKLILFADGEGLKMGAIYEKIDNMLREIKETMAGSKFEYEWDRMEAIILARWEKMNIPIHALEFALTPHYYDPQYLTMLAPGRLPHKPPNQDIEVVKGVMTPFGKIAETAKETRVYRE